MIENILILFFDIFLFTIYTILGISLFMTIQLISYRIFKFNLYKFVMYYLIDKEVQ